MFAQDLIRQQIARDQARDDPGLGHGRGLKAHLIATLVTHLTDPVGREDADQLRR